MCGDGGAVWKLDTWGSGNTRGGPPSEYQPHSNYFDLTITSCVYDLKQHPAMFRSD